MTLHEMIEGAMAILVLGALLVTCLGIGTGP